MPQSTISTDVVIAGGGLNGLAAAVCLAGPASRMPFKCVLVDAGDPSEQATPVSDGRASAIALSSRRMLEAMGIWAELAPHAQPIRHIAVTDSGVASTVRPTLLQFGEPGPLGPSAHIIENRYLYAALARAAGNLPGLTIVPHATVEAMETDNRHIWISIGGGQHLRAALTIAADGRRSLLRELAGIETVAWSYDQSAIVTTVVHERPHEGCAYEHFRPAGPFAILPLTGNRASLVWTEATHDAERIVASDDEDFTTELTKRFGEELGWVRAEGPRRVYPLGLSIAKSFRARRLALIGDAAHVVHPIAGLGFNLGLRDIAALAECIGDAVQLGMDPASESVLVRYERWRRIDTLRVAAATDGLNRLFSNDNAAVRLLRNAGLRVVDAVRPLKTAFMHEAAGVTGALPRLLLGRPA